jgi:4-hydroxy-tetrahydrodipicolinate synthase
MEEYFVEISESVPEDFSVYIYCIPQCAANDIKPEIIDRILKRTKNIIGIKYSYPDFLRVKDYLLCNDGDFSVVVGTDRLFLAGLSMGCDGTVSGCSNADPTFFVDIFENYSKGEMGKAKLAQIAANEICEMTLNGANMAMFKSALEYHGLPAAHMRKPGLDLTEQEKNALFEKLDAFYKQEYNYTILVLISDVSVYLQPEIQ